MADAGVEQYGVFYDETTPTIECDSSYDKIEMTSFTEFPVKY